MDPRAVTTGHPLPPDVGETFRRLWAGGRARWSPAPPAARPDRCSTSPARSRTPSRKADRRGRGGTTPTPAAPQRPRRATTDHAPTGPTPPRPAGQTTRHRHRNRTTRARRRSTHPRGRPTRHDPSHHGPTAAEEVV